jgi:hypothetical protein
MAGYAGTPLPKKLGIEPGAHLAVLNAPQGFRAQLDPLPYGVVVHTDLAHTCDVIVLFARTQPALAAHLTQAVAALAPTGGLWIAWPKRGARVPTDLDEHVVRTLGLAQRLVDNKICAIDEVWSGLRFVVRRADRANWPTL